MRVREKKAQKNIAMRSAGFMTIHFRTHAQVEYLLCEILESLFTHNLLACAGYLQVAWQSCALFFAYHAKNSPMRLLIPSKKKIKKKSTTKGSIPSQARSNSILTHLG
jgi:hypothetical protein